MREFGKDRQCEICGDYHRTLLEARMCCDIPPPNEPIADKMLRLIGMELAQCGVVSQEQAIDAQILGNVRILSDLKERARKSEVDNSATESVET